MPDFRILISLRGSKKKRAMAEDVNNDGLAQRAMLAGAIIALIGLIVIPLTWPEHSRPSWWLTYDVNTGVIGDTIGGIAGPILNFTGLIIVYYSLREQITTNKTQFKQIKDEVERGRNDREFDLSFKLVEKLIDEAKHNSETFAKIGVKDWEVNWNGKLGATPAEMVKDDDLFEKYKRTLKTLADSFLMIVNRLESPSLNLDQQSVLQRILTMQYEPYLRECKKEYEVYFTDAESVPLMLTAVNQQLDVLDKQRVRIDKELEFIKANPVAV